MTTSPLQFAKDFGKLKSDLASQPAADLKLLLLVDFWPSLERHRDDKAYRSYFEEYIPLLLHLISEENLHDLTLPELQVVLNTLQSVNDVMSPDDRAQVQNKIRLTTICLAKMLFYVGCVEEGVKLCAGLAGEASTISIENSELDGLSEYNALRLVSERFKDKRPSLYNILKDVLDAWEGERETLSHERANCLFVEKGGHHHSKPRVGAGLVSAENEGGRQAPTLRAPERTHSVIPVETGIQQWRGRMRVLQGRVELFGKSAKTDEITFANQIVKPDDRFIGVAYDSLEAVRQVFKAEGFKDKASAYYHAHFSIRDSTHTFTGDSIGLAVGLVTYTQLLKPEIMRQERFLASDVAFTGGVNEQGQLLAVNKETLGVKVERAFFSPVKYLVLPEPNLAEAKRHVEKMKQRFHRRRLHLVPAERLTEVIENHNVIRAEKVCMSEFVVRKVYRYSRMTKVQVPLLTAMLLVLLAILFPKWTPWFDWHIAKIEVIGNRFRTLNAKGQELWVSEEFERPLDPHMYSPAPSMGREVAIAADVNGNGRDELFFVPFYSGQKSWRHTLRFYNDDATFKREVSVIERTRYPGDDENAGYCAKDMSVIDSPCGDHFILTGADCSLPSRCQFMLFDTAGNKVSGPYLHTGCLALRKWTLDDIDGDGDEELIVGNTNNRYNRAALFVLDPMNLSGVSPPYDNELFLSSDMPKGSQLYYVAFPETPLSAGDDIRNGAEYFSYDPVSKSWEVHVREGIQLQDPPGVTVIYRLDSNFIPEWAVFGDGHFKAMSDWQARQGLPVRETRRQVEYRLVNDVIVYHGDSIVHHPAAGIRFYGR